MSFFVNAFDYNGQTLYASELENSWDLAFRNTGSDNHPYIDIKSRVAANSSGRKYLFFAWSDQPNFIAQRGSSLNLKLDVSQLEPGIYVGIVDDYWQYPNTGRLNEDNELNNFVFINITGQPTGALDYDNNSNVDVKDASLWLKNDQVPESQECVGRIVGAPSSGSRTPRPAVAKSEPVESHTPSCRCCQLLSRRTVFSSSLLI